MAVAIRAATVEDARSLAEVHNEGWGWGYRGLVPDSFLDDRDDDTSEQRWIEYFIEEEHEADGVFVAEDDVGAIGIIACGPASQSYGAEPPLGVGEVQLLYLRERAQGMGVGRALLQRGLEHLREMGFTKAILWVMDSNSRARRFYEAGGWRADGATGEHRFDDVSVPVMRYACDL